MQYLGSKQRIAPWILDEVSGKFPNTQYFVDLMSGSGSVAHEAHQRGLGIVANDVQPYSFAVLRSMFELPREGLTELIDQLERTDFTEELLLENRGAAADWLKTEDEFLNQTSAGPLDWQEYRDFCLAFNGDHTLTTKKFDLFTTYYSNTYFGVRQSLEIDALRQIGERLTANTEHHLVAALISAMTFTASTTTHLAQFLKPTSLRNSEHLLARRSKSIVAAVTERLRKLDLYPLPTSSSVTNMDYQSALQGLATPTKDTVVYVDPPYFKEHYSRYYHVLDTLALYDYPELTFNKRLDTVTIGRYRSDRFTSDFGLQSKVAAAFTRLFELASVRSLSLAISYANTSLLSAEEIVTIAGAAGYSAELRETALFHSGQGQNAAKGNVVEYLFLCSHDA